MCVVRSKLEIQALTLTLLGSLPLIMTYLSNFSSYYLTLSFVLCYRYNYINLGSYFLTVELFQNSFGFKTPASQFPNTSLNNTMHVIFKVQKVINSLLIILSLIPSTESKHLKHHSLPLFSPTLFTVLAILNYLQLYASLCKL